jgi:hypothetical protein
MNRRDMLKMSAATLAGSLQPDLRPEKPFNAAGSETVKQWGAFEIALKGSFRRKPYKEVALTAEFTHEHRTVPVHRAVEHCSSKRSFRLRSGPNLCDSPPLSVCG